MSKLIVEMEIPKRCTRCGVRMSCMRYVHGLFDNIAEDLKPLIGDKDCIIKGVLPEDHGDLIDRNYLLKFFDGINNCIDKEDVLSANAVIAEERKDDGTAVD